MENFTYTRKELSKLNASDFNDKTLIFVVDPKTDETIYTISLEKGQYKTFALKSTVQDKNWNYLDCTAGVRGGWPYYIADFIRR